MTTTALKVVAPLAAALPDPPQDQYFTDAQWTTLMALMDTIIPSVKRESVSGSKPTIGEEHIPDVIYSALAHQVQRTMTKPPTDVQLDEYLAEKPSDIPEFQDLLKRTLVQYAREDARKGFSFLLSGLKYVPNQSLPLDTDRHQARGLDPCCSHLPSHRFMSNPCRHGLKFSATGVRLASLLFKPRISKSALLPKTSG